MSVHLALDPAPILALDIAGTFVFGLSGGLAAVRARILRDLLPAPAPPGAVPEQRRSRDPRSFLHAVSVLGA